VEGEVVNLPASNIKAFFVATFLGFSLSSSESSLPELPIPLAEANENPKIIAPLIADPLPAPTAAGICGSDMILIDGEYCPDVIQNCLKWIDPPPYENLRCAEYQKPAKCKVPTVHRHFCVDREEYVAKDATDGLPMVRVNWNDAQKLCNDRGTRLCKEAEWEFACEGPEMSPYPYGWKRDSTLCNFDKTNLGGMEEKLNDLRAPITDYPNCKSPFGVHDMVGNVDEWTEREGFQAPNRSSLRGGWWLPGRNRCRAATTQHGEDYSGKQVGFRCCKDAPASESASE
jgi:hypothetical protein